MIRFVRLIVVVGSLGVSALLMWMAFALGTQTDWGQLLINLSSEIVGVVITVAIVEAFLERRRLVERARRLAWDAVHAVESGVWVWQGGPRDLETDELLGILHAVDEGDFLADHTESMFLNIGTRSRRQLTNDLDAIERLPGLMNGLEQLARLSGLRDGRTLMSPRKVADILEEGTVELARALGQPTDPYLAGLIQYRDPSRQSQERRHFGERGAGGREERAVGVEL